MRTDHHTRSFTVAASPAEVAALLADPERLVEIHPLLDEVTIRERSSTGGETVVTFELLEHVPFWRLRIPNRYRGEVRTFEADPHRIELRGWSRPGVVVHSVFTCAPAAAGSAVTQELRISAPAWVAAFVFRTARAAHDRQAEAIRARFASPRPA